MKRCMQYLHTTESHGNILPRGGLWGLPKVPSITRYSPLLEAVSIQYKSYTMKQLHTMTKLYSEKVIYNDNVMQCKRLHNCIVIIRQQKKMRYLQT